MSFIEDGMAFRADITFDPRPLRRARAVKGWNLSLIAQVVGCSVTTVSMTLSGKSRKASTVAEICKVLGVDVSECYPVDGPTVPGPTGSGPSGNGKDAGGGRKSALRVHGVAPSGTLASGLCRSGRRVA